MIFVSNNTLIGVVIITAIFMFSSMDFFFFFKDAAPTKIVFFPPPPGLRGPGFRLFLGRAFVPLASAPDGVGGVNKNPIKAQNRRYDTGYANFFRRVRIPGAHMA